MVYVHAVDQTGVELPPEAREMIQAQEQQQFEQLRAISSMRVLQPGFYLRESFQVRVNCVANTS